MALDKEKRKYVLKNIQDSTGYGYHLVYNMLSGKQGMRDEHFNAMRPALLKLGVILYPFKYGWTRYPYVIEQKEAK